MPAPHSSPFLAVKFIPPAWKSRNFSIRSLGTHHLITHHRIPFMTRVNASISPRRSGSISNSLAFPPPWSGTRPSLIVYHSLAMLKISNHSHRQPPGFVLIPIYHCNRLKLQFTVGIYLRLVPIVPIFSLCSINFSLASSFVLSNFMTKLVVLSLVNSRASTSCT